jgi:hypothetical protein
MVVRGEDKEDVDEEANRLFALVYEQPPFLAHGKDHRWVADATIEFRELWEHWVGTKSRHQMAQTIADWVHQKGDPELQVSQSYLNMYMYTKQTFAQ